MGKRIPLKAVVPASASHDIESIMLHVYQHSWKLYCRGIDLVRVVDPKQITRVKQVPTLSTTPKDKAKLWGMLRESHQYFQLIESKSTEAVPLPFWNLEFQDEKPVFRFIIDQRDHCYWAKGEALLVDDSEVPPLVKPIPKDAILKIQTGWPLANVQQAFVAMCEQGWVEIGAETIVEQRFTGNHIDEMVDPDVKLFNWLQPQALLREVSGIMELTRAKLPPHFLHKGKPLRKNALRSGRKATEGDFYTKARNLLRPHLP